MRTRFAMGSKVGRMSAGLMVIMFVGKLPQLKVGPHLMVEPER
jgi:hypothetical protein